MADGLKNSKFRIVKNLLEKWKMWVDNIYYQFEIIKCQHEGNVINQTKGCSPLDSGVPIAIGRVTTAILSMLKTLVESGRWVDDGVEWNIYDCLTVIRRLMGEANPSSLSRRRTSRRRSWPLHHGQAYPYSFCACTRYSWSWGNQNIRRYSSIQASIWWSRHQSSGLRTSCLWLLALKFFSFILLLIFFVFWFFVSPLFFFLFACFDSDFIWFSLVVVSTFCAFSFMNF